MAVMNGPGGMYKIKPYFDKPVVFDIPDCIYKVNSFHGDNKTEVGGDMDERVKSLEQRQEAILEKLNKLKTEVDNLSRNVPADQTITSSSTKLNKGGVLQDLVIHANPNAPPLSIMVLYEQLCKQYPVLGACYVHSSAKGVSNQHKTTFNNNGVDRDRASYQVAITVIWTDVQNGPLLMVNPSIQTAIQGEANIARYLSRLMDPSYDSGDILVATEIDSLLDLLPQLVDGNNKEKAAAVRTINAKLGKGSWLIGDAMSLADVVVWSAIQQSGQAQGASGNVKRWLDNCAQMPVFRKATSFLC